jgi:hypothetical protein
MLKFFSFLPLQGFGHVDFFTPEQAQKALISLEVISILIELESIYSSVTVNWIGMETDRIR